MGPNGNTHYFFFFKSSDEWGKIKLEIATLPFIFIHVVCRFNSISFAMYTLALSLSCTNVVKKNVVYHKGVSVLTGDGREQTKQHWGVVSGRQEAEALLQERESDE